MIDCFFALQFVDVLKSYFLPYRSGLLTNISCPSKYDLHRTCSSLTKKDVSAQRQSIHHIYCRGALPYLGSSEFPPSCPLDNHLPGGFEKHKRVMDVLRSPAPPRNVAPT